ncbi:hypothetical protein ACPF04_06565 [Campylobacter sp. MOP51]|uniref:hypothetical protein n=1 Tax=Campylobacter canis TaxID=3378588 RepID=UPI003C6A7767
MEKLGAFENAIFKHFVMDVTPIESSPTTDHILEQPGLEGINFKIKPYMADEIYKTSDNEVVTNIPNNLQTQGINLNMTAVIELCSVILGSISTYIYNMRTQVANKDLCDNGIIIKPNAKKTSTFLKVRANRHFYREGKYGRYKLYMSIYQNNKEIVQLKFTKKDIQLLIYIIKTIMSSYSKIKAVHVSSNILNSSGKVVSTESSYCMKFKNSVAINSIWLHSQELVSLMYVAEQLVHTQNIEQNVKPLFLKSRQIAIQLHDPEVVVFQPQSNSFTSDDIEKEIFDTNLNNSKSRALALVLRKMDGNHNEVVTDENHRYLKIPISAKFLTLLYLYISLDMLHYNDAEISNTPIDTSFMKSGRVASAVSKSKYRINMQESVLTLGISKKEGSTEDRMYLSGFTKPGIYSHNGLNNQYQDSQGNTHNVLTEFSINLGRFWGTFIKALSVACTKSYVKEGRSANVVMFNIPIREEDTLRYNYYFKIVSSESNDAALVLEIKKTIGVKLADGNFEQREIAVYRQPLFHRYAFQLLISTLALGKFVKDYIYLKDIMLKNIVQYRYSGFINTGFASNLNTVLEYGIHKINDKAYWGMKEAIQNPDKTSLLDRQDTILLNQSSLFKLLRGEFQPFVGHKICIGPDNYLTDTYGEINMKATNIDGKSNDGEDDKKRLFSDIDWAIVLFFGTLAYDA